MSSTARTIDVAAAIDTRPLGRFQIHIIFWCTLVAMIDGFDAQSIGFVAPLIAKDLHIAMRSFGLIFGAGTLGLTIGALTLPVLADRWGRRSMTIIALVIFGVVSLLTVLADSFSSLVVVRLVAGLGIGAATPNVIALSTEYAPKRMRALLVTVMTSGFPLGAVLGGLISAKMIPIWGWHSVFYLGGVAPLILAAVLFAVLPESIRLLIAQNDTSKRAIGYLKRVAPDLSIGAGDHLVISEPHVKGFAVRQLFTDGRARVTALLWLAFFMNFLLMFFMYFWLPPMMQRSGMPIQRAILAIVLFNLGGVVGGIALGRQMDRVNPYRVLGIAYAVGALSVGAIGFVSFSVPLMMAAVMIGGFCAVGGQTSANALAANSYPTQIRATGVGWALGIGRVGSIIGPVIGGAALSMGWEMREIFLAAAVPAIFASIAIWVLRIVVRAARGPAPAF